MFDIQRKAGSSVKSPEIKKPENKEQEKPVAVSGRTSFPNRVGSQN